MYNDQEKFEIAVMTKIISENPELSTKLKKQYDSAIIVNREFTGVGFFTTFEITDKTSRLENYLNLELGNTQARIEGLEFGAGFVLFVRNGLIELLECFSYGGETWPSQVISFSLE